MSIFNLSWSISIDFPGQGGNIDSPDWTVIRQKLSLVLKSIGSVGLENEDESGRTRSLTVQAENAMYFITFGIETENDWVVRTYKNSDVKPPGEMVNILGDRWNTQVICNDDALVMTVFNEFFNTGDVSTKYLT
jgi:hypothetical protein